MKLNFLKPLGFYLTIIALTVFLTFSFSRKANADEVPQSNLIVVRVFEVSGGFGSSRIIISYGKDKHEEIEIENTSNTAHLAENTDKINYVLNKIINTGYDLISSTASGPNGCACIFILKKKS